VSGTVTVDLVEGVIVVRYDGRPTDEVFDAYLERYTELAMRGVPYAAVYSTLPTARIPLGGQARRQAAWMKKHQPIFRDRCRGLAFALGSPVMRGVFRGVLALQPLAAEHVVVDDEIIALAWAKGRLHAEAE
jgi:hypothetical protein